VGLILWGRSIIPGQASGVALVSSEPLSFWGGYDYQTGTIIDQRHPLAGVCAAGRILALPFARGSSTTTAVLLEAVKAGTAPAAILTTAPDAFFALASIVADEMYARPIPLVVLKTDDFARLQSGQKVSVAEDGQVLLADVPGSMQ
jgi:predicted aconitase with swiveling domain